MQKFWRATGQSNLADRMEDCSTSQKAATWEQNQTLEAFTTARRSCVKFDCPVARQNFSLLGTAHDPETGAHSESSAAISNHTKMADSDYLRVLSVFSWKELA